MMKHALPSPITLCVTRVRTAFDSLAQQQGSAIENVYRVYTDLLGETDQANRKLLLAIFFKFLKEGDYQELTKQLITEIYQFLSDENWDCENACARNPETASKQLSDEKKAKLLAIVDVVTGLTIPTAEPVVTGLGSTFLPTEQNLWLAYNVHNFATTQRVGELRNLISFLNPQKIYLDEISPDTHRKNYEHYLRFNEARNNHQRMERNRAIEEFLRGGGTFFYEKSSVVEQYKYAGLQDDSHDLFLQASGKLLGARIITRTISKPQSGTNHRETIATTTEGEILVWIPSSANTAGGISLSGLVAGCVAEEDVDVPVTTENKNTPLQKRVPITHRAEKTLNGEQNEFTVFVKRFTGPITNLSKNSQNIVLDELQLRTSDAENPNRYVPTAFVYHEGDLKNGHYKCCVREEDGLWYEYNDLAVPERRQISDFELEHAMQQASYVKYTKLDDNGRILRTLLPSQQTCPLNLGNTCYVTAALVFLSSFVTVGQHASLIPDFAVPKNLRNHVLQAQNLLPALQKTTSTKTHQQTPLLPHETHKTLTLTSTSTATAAPPQSNPQLKKEKPKNHTLPNLSQHTNNKFPDMKGARELRTNHPFFTAVKDLLDRSVVDTTGLTERSVVTFKEFGEDAVTTTIDLSRKTFQRGISPEKEYDADDDAGSDSLGHVKCVQASLKDITIDGRSVTPNTNQRDKSVEKATMAHETSSAKTKPSAPTTPISTKTKSPAPLPPRPPLRNEKALSPRAFSAKESLDLMAKFFVKEENAKNDIFPGLVSGIRKHFDWWFVNPHDNPNDTSLLDKAAKKYKIEDVKTLISDEDYMKSWRAMVRMYFDEIGINVDPKAGSPLNEEKFYRFVTNTYPIRLEKIIASIKTIHAVAIEMGNKDLADEMLAVYGRIYEGFRSYEGGVGTAMFKDQLKICDGPGRIKSVKGDLITGEIANLCLKNSGAFHAVTESLDHNDKHSEPFQPRATAIRDEKKGGVKKSFFGGQEPQEEAYQALMSLKQEFGKMDENDEDVADLKKHLLEQCEKFESQYLAVCSQNKPCQDFSSFLCNVLEFVEENHQSSIAEHPLTAASAGLNTSVHPTSAPPEQNDKLDLKNRIRENISSGEELRGDSLMLILRTLARDSENGDIVERKDGATKFVSAYDPVELNLGRTPAVQIEEKSKRTGTSCPQIDILPIHNGSSSWLIAIADHERKRLICFDPKGNFGGRLGLLGANGKNLDKEKIMKNLFTAESQEHVKGYQIVEVCHAVTELADNIPHEHSLIPNDSTNSGIYCAAIAEYYLNLGELEENNVLEQQFINHLRTSLSNISGKTESDKLRNVFIGLVDSQRDEILNITAADTEEPLEEDYANKEKTPQQLEEQEPDNKKEYDPKEGAHTTTATAKPPSPKPKRKTVIKMNEMPFRRK